MELPQRALTGRTLRAVATVGRLPVARSGLRGVAALVLGLTELRTARVDGATAPYVPRPAADPEGQGGGSPP